MKKIIFFTVIAFIFSTYSFTQVPNRISQKPGGAYLGLKPPGTVPEIFAPGFISTGMDEATITFSPDGMECFYIVMTNGHETIVHSKNVDGVWSSPEVAFFSGKYFDGFPCFHPDGSKLFFHSNRPLPNCASFNIWYIEKTGAGWSEPKPIGPPINGVTPNLCPTVSKFGTIYFTRQFQDGSEYAFCSKFVDGKYMEPEQLPATVNTRKDQFHHIIASDESYLILPLAGREDAVAPGENFYVSFKGDDGKWGNLINVGKEINGMRIWGLSSFSPDGKYFFFSAFTRTDYVLIYDKKMTYSDLQDMTILNPSRGKIDIFWVDAKIIESLRPKAIK